MIFIYIVYFAKLGVVSINLQDFGWFCKYETVVVIVKFRKLLFEVEFHFKKHERKYGEIK